MDGPKRLTLLLLRHEGRVLLATKKRGFGVGKVNGFGGKVEPGETISAAAAREMLEESCCSVTGIQRRGILSFDMLGDGNQLEVHVFAAGGFEGEPTETEEMAPLWVEESAIPYDKMWLDDKFWIPLFLDDKFFRGYFT